MCGRLSRLGLAAAPSLLFTLHWPELRLQATVSSCQGGWPLWARCGPGGKGHRQWGINTSCHTLTQSWPSSPRVPGCTLEPCWPRWLFLCSEHVGSPTAGSGLCALLSAFPFSESQSSLLAGLAGLASPSLQSPSNPPCPAHVSGPGPSDPWQLPALAMCVPGWEPV